MRERVQSNPTSDILRPLAWFQHLDEPRSRSSRPLQLFALPAGLAVERKAIKRRIVFSEGASVRSATMAMASTADRAVVSAVKRSAKSA